MEYTITVSNDQKYIVIKIKGDINRHNAMPLNLEAYKIAKEQNIRKFFVDVTEARNTDDPIDSYEFAHKDMIQTAGIERGSRVAALVHPGDHSHDFMETVLHNAGGVFKLFHSIDQAMAFLLDDN